MKQTLVIVFVFLAAFAATILLSREVFFPPPITGPDAPGAGSADPEADALARRRADIAKMLNRDAVAAGKEKAVEAGAAASPATGEIEAMVKTDDGREARNLAVTIFPPSPEPPAGSGGKYRIANLPAGTYYVGVAGEGYLPRSPVEVSVERGKKYDIELWLERGLELRGTVIEDVDQRPIPGAMIDFNGFAQAITDSSGAFKTDVVPPKALDVITLTHDEFDRNVVLHPVIPETQGIVLAMSRGKGTVTGRILAAGSDPVPNVFRVRVIRNPGGIDEIRRDRTFRGVTNFEIRGVFGGPNALEVSFPGTAIATRRIDFDLGREPAIHLDVDLARGGLIEGAYTAPSGLIASIPIVLVDTGNHVMGETRTDPAGKFRFEHAAEGEYAIRIDARIPPIHTESFKVEDGKSKAVTVDGQTGRLK